MSEVAVIRATREADSAAICDSWLGVFLLADSFQSKTEAIPNASTILRNEKTIQGEVRQPSPVLAEELNERVFELQSFFLKNIKKRNSPFRCQDLGSFRQQFESEVVKCVSEMCANKERLSLELPVTKWLLPVVRNIL